MPRGKQWTKACPDCGKVLTTQAKFDKHVRDVHDWNDKDVEKQEKGYQIEQVLGHWWGEEGYYLYDIKWIGYKAISSIYDCNFGEDQAILKKYRKKVGFPMAKKNMRYKGKRYARAKSGWEGYSRSELHKIPLDLEKTKRLIMMRSAENCPGFVKRRVLKGNKEIEATYVALCFEKMDDEEDPKELTSLFDVTKFMETGNKKDLPGYGEGPTANPYERLVKLIMFYVENQLIPKRLAAMTLP